MLLQLAPNSGAEQKQETQWPPEQTAQLKCLLGPVRYGRSTFADYQHATVDCNAEFGKIDVPAPREPISGIEEASLSGTHIYKHSASSKEDALYRTLFMRVQGESPHLRDMIDVRPEHVVTYVLRDEHGNLTNHSCSTSAPAVGQPEATTGSGTAFVPVELVT